MSPPHADGRPIAGEIFRAYDIRGIVGETLTESAVYRIGRAFAAEALKAGQTLAAVGGDGRVSTPELVAALLDGLGDGGLDAVDVGIVPTPLLYYAAHELAAGTGVMVTGSHNPAAYNGLKMMIGGATLAEDRISALRRRVEAGDCPSGAGTRTQARIVERYGERVAGGVRLARPLKVVVDCGNGVGGLVAPQLLAALGCEVEPLFSDVDGRFPNHPPDPAEAANLVSLIERVQARQADLGIAFDGDADRLGVVTESGEIVLPERVMMLFAKDILGRQPGGRMVFDVKCSSRLKAAVDAFGGVPILCRTGHSHIKAKMREHGAVFGGEFSGHLCFGEGWFGFDDAIYSAARLLEILARSPHAAGEVFAEFPPALATPEIKVPTTEQAKFGIVSRLAERLAEGPACQGGELTRVDGVRVDYADGWGLVRASNTSPVLSLRFEAVDHAALERLQREFDEALKAIDPALSFLDRSAAGDSPP